MDLKETAVLLKEINLTYPKKLDTSDMGLLVKTWQKHLNKYPAEMVHKKLTYHIQHSNFCPTVADLIPKEEYDQAKRKEETDQYLDDKLQIKEGVLDEMPDEIRQKFKELIDNMK